MNWVRARGFVPANGSVKPDAGVHPPSTARLNGVIPATPPHGLVRGDLHEFERLIDRAWADYAAASIGAAAAQSSSGTAASNVEQPSAPSAAIATDHPARQEIARTVRSFQPTSSGAPRVVRDGISDREAQAILLRMEALLDPFRIAPSTPPVELPDTPKPPPTSR